MPTVNPLSFFGLKFSDVFIEENRVTYDLRKSSSTENPTPRADIDLVYVLSARTTALSQIADIELLQQNKRQQDEFDLVDDIHRMALGIEIAIQVCALRAGKKPEELTDADYVIPIFYNGRSIHNEDLKRALKNPELQRQLGKDQLPYYPARLFTISAIYNPRKNAMGKNTVGQAQSFRHYLEYHRHEHIAVVSSAFHLPRVARTLGADSPQMDEASLDENLIANIVKWRSSPIDFVREKATKTKYAHSLEHLKLYLFGVHKHEARNGIRLDLLGENEAMQKYTSISRWVSRNVFSTDMDVFFYQSLAMAIVWHRYMMRQLIREQQNTTKIVPVTLAPPKNDPFGTVTSRRNLCYGFGVVIYLEQNFPEVNTFLMTVRDAIIKIVDPERAPENCPRKRPELIKTKSLHAAVYGSAPYLHQNDYASFFESRTDGLDHGKFLHAIQAKLSSYLGDGEPLLLPIGLEFKEEDGTILARYQVVTKDEDQRPLASLKKLLDSGRQNSAPVWDPNPLRDTTVAIVLCVVAVRDEPSKIDRIKTILRRSNEGFKALGAQTISNCSIIKSYDKRTLTLGKHVEIFAEVDKPQPQNFLRVK